jgi:WD40 repeat protein
MATTGWASLAGQFKSNRSTITSIAWSPDSTELAIGSILWPLQVWDLQSQKVVRRLTGANGTTISVSWSGDGKFIAANTIEPDVTFRVWSRSTSQIIYSNQLPDRVRSVAWSPDGKSIAVAIGGKRLEIGNTSPTQAVSDTTAPNSRIDVYSTGDWAVQASLPITTYSDFISWNPESNQLAFVSTPAYSVTDSLVVWNVRDSHLLREPSIQEESINALSWSPDGKYIASASSDGYIALWQPDLSGSPRKLRHGGRVLSLAWSPDGKYLASGGEDMMAKIWEVSSGNLVTAIQHKNSVDAVSWSPDGSYLASGGHDDTLSIWDLRP